ncbi:MAG: hypothetical protein IID54_06195 [Proteobacteria bacterium]|nr:hypothetical protein [Pseudomonadota bacterium]
MEQEVHALEKDFLLIEETYSRDVMRLILASAYVRKLLDNARVVRYLAKTRRCPRRVPAHCRGSLNYRVTKAAQPPS